MIKSCLVNQAFLALKQKQEFQKLTLIKDARELITSQMIYQMFPPASLNTLSNTIESSSFSAQDFINGQLQQVFLPWPLSLLHLLPRWMLITGITIIVTLLTKIFLDPALAICHLCRESSMSIIDRITTVLVPTVSISRRHQKAAAIEQGEEHPLKKLSKDQGDRLAELESRVSHILLKQLKIEAKLKIANQSEVQNLPALSSEVQCLPALISENRR